MDRPILELRGITKTFGTKVANRDVSLRIRPGTVHAIVGENGAGKSTLMNMISGNLQPDSGEIIVDGEPVVVTDPKKADALGIGMVHQHFKLVPSLSVASNIFLGNEMSSGPGVLDRRAMEKRVAALTAELGLELDPRDRVQDLSVGERQRVEIVKALSHDTRLLILDEPTAVLTPSETDELFVVVRRLAAQGCAVVFISHKLGEVLAIADEITVIRDGEVVGSRSAEGLSQSDIASMMVGREVLLRIKHTPSNPAQEVLRVDDLSAIDQRGAVAVKNLSLTVRAGEIVGIAGVEGNGQSELAAAVAGMYLPPRGRVSIAGNDVTAASVAERRARGLSYIPEDRHEEGAAPTLSIAENIAAGHLRPPIARRGWLSLDAIRSEAARLIAKFDVRGAQPETPIGSLSGGNMQKVIIAREFESDPALLMISQPTRGVDVGAMEFVHNSIVALRDKGAGVLLFSADLNEVMSLSDRLLVMYRGEVIAEFTQDNMTELAVGLAMAGAAPTEDALREAEAERERVSRELEASGTHLADASADIARVDELTTTSVVLPKTVAVETSRKSIGATLSAFASKTFTSALQPVFAVLAALIIGAVIILVIGQNPITAYIELFTSAWRTPFGIGSIIAMFVPLAIMSAGTIISFRAGFFNIGGEGQLYFGAFAGAYAGFTFQGLPPIVHVALVLVFGAAAGGLWGLIPGFLTGFLKVDVVVITLLLSQVALLVTSFLVTGPFADPTATLAGSPRVLPSALLPVFDPAFGFAPDLLIALAIAVILGFVLNRTTWGLRVKELGELNRFADYIGTSSKRMALQVMSLSGAVAGIAGALFVIGPNGGRFLQAFSPGFAFLAITVALLARLNPWASLVAALFYATMMAGGTGIQSVGVPFPMISVLQGLIVIAITATFAVNLRRRRRLPAATASADPIATTKGASK
ncbi:ATP-binding cassette domain-containing protein [Microbacterium sp. EST19A]|uniref:ATP-binding cassette domain-containing protein n=1 Tax=Microbacterium sp. EST19A TaxID=2862681 RepID=UPI001CBAA1BC|nr:ATP-binding cassette domain-containing protein [Microbacterium sp. EST19A]